jgi:hypothetical protein
MTVPLNVSAIRDYLKSMIVDADEDILDIKALSSEETHIADHLIIMADRGRIDAATDVLDNMDDLLAIEFDVVVGDDE